MHALITDVRYALRLARRRPMRAAAAVIALTLGLGGTTALFSVVRAVLLRPLPYASPESLIILEATYLSDGSRRSVLTGFETQNALSVPGIFAGVAAAELWTTNKEPRKDLAREEGAERLRGGIVSRNFFDVLGVGAALGRTFAAEDPPGQVVILSDGLWQRQFGGDRGILGKTIRLSGEPLVVIGVLPPRLGFTYPEETDCWMLMRPEREKDAGDALRYHVIARLRPGATPAQATAALGALGPVTNSQGRGPQTLSARPLHEYAVGQVRPLVALLSGAVVLLLAIACANVALLLLAQAQVRVREMALRAALGARRARLIRHLLTESAVFAAVGTFLGVILASSALPLVQRLVPPHVPRVEEIALDGWVVGFAAVAGILSALLAGLAPAWLVSRAEAAGALAAATTNIALGSRAPRWRRALVASQVTLVVCLLVGASLLLHSFARLLQVDLGFQPAQLVTMEMRLLNERYRGSTSDARLAAFHDELLARVRAVPGVLEAASTSAVPFRGTDWTIAAIRAPGETKEHFANMREVDAGFFRIMGITLRHGRYFDARDGANARKTVIVSESLARALFGDRPAVGRVLHWREDREVVGVVQDVRYQRPEVEPRPAMYLPRAQAPSELLCLVIRTSLPVEPLAAAVRHIVHDIDPMQPVERPAALAGIVSNSMAERRFHALATASFALLALLLAMVGLFGAVSSAVQERFPEIGIRVALGADARGVVGLLLRQGLSPVLVGLVAGGMVSVGLVRMLRRFLFEVSPLDVSSFAAVVLLLALTSLIAAYLPARRATRIDPMLALRVE